MRLAKLRRTALSSVSILIALSASRTLLAETEGGTRDSERESSEPESSEPEGAKPEASDQESAKPEPGDQETGAAPKQASEAETSPKDDATPPADQSSPESKEPDPSEDSASSEKAKSGGVVLIVFLADEQLPAGIEISTDTGESAVTSEDGIVRFEVPAGKRTFTVKTPKVLLPDYAGADPKVDQIVDVVVTGGETSEVLVNLTNSGELTADVEGPETEEPKPGAVEDKPKAIQFGSISGKVISDETKEPIAGARVFVRGVDVEELTAADGSFSVKVPVGTHGVSAIHKKYSTQTQNDVEVVKDAATEVTLEMTPAAFQLDDVVVIAPYIEGGVAGVVAEKRETTAVAEVIGSEQMEAAGDSSAAGALKRVTGLTVVGGKFIYVRGMGERYSSTLLNGLNLPSPEPERRVVPLDLFPTGILESVVVQKTYSPDMPGEFGGGSVQLRTKSFPEKFTFSVSASTGANTETTFKDGLTYRGSSTDWLGIDDGTRDLPAIIANFPGKLRPQSRTQMGPDRLSAEQLEEMGDSFEPNYRVFNRTIPLDHGAEITVGNTFDVGFPLGFMASVSYDRKFRFRGDRIARTLAAGPDGPVINNDQRVKRDTTEVNTGGLLAIGAEPLPNQKIEANTILLRMSEDETLLITGDNFTFGANIRSFQLKWVERQLLTQQLVGTHPFSLDPDNQELDKEPKLTWRYGFSRAERLEPDRRRYRYVLSPDLGQFWFQSESGAHERYFSDLEDSMHEGRIDFEWPLHFDQDDHFVLKPKTGLTLLSRERDVGGRRFRLDPVGGDRASAGLRTQEPDDVLHPDYISPDGHILLDTTLDQPTGRGADTYRARQSVLAGYLMAELRFLKDFDLMVGARLERMIQVTTSFNQFADPGEPIDGDEVSARLDDVDFLPAATLTWRFRENHQLRFGFGQTVSRPDFREKALSRFFNVENDIALRGNPDLKRAVIQNYDARWEWYPSPDESFSIATFFKNFKDPIEVVSVQAAATEWSWGNSLGATNFGVELEARKRFGFVNEALENVYAATNLALIRSSVELDTETLINGLGVNPTSEERTLQGQSPYVVNVQVGYDDVEEGEGTNFAVLYNVFGPRITAVGSGGKPDIVEEPHHQLDLVYGHRLSKHFKFGVKAKNLINGRLRTTGTLHGQTVLRDAVTSGRSVSVSAKYSY